MEAILVQIIQWFSLEKGYVRRFILSSVIYTVLFLVWLVVIHFACHCTKNMPIERPHNRHQEDEFHKFRQSFHCCPRRRQMKKRLIEKRKGLMTLLSGLRDHLQRLWHATETWTELVRCLATQWPYGHIWSSDWW